MDSVRQYTKTIFLKSFIFFASVFILCAVTQNNRMLASFSFGFAVSLVNFYLLALDIEKVTLVLGLKFSSRLILKFFLRYAMIGLAMVCALRYNANILAFGCGLFVVQMVLYGDTLLGKRKDS